MGFSRQAIEFTDYDGMLMLDMDEPENSSIEVTFNLANGGFWVGTPGDEQFENHLSSDDLLGLSEHPTATFVATSFETEDGETGTMTGDLTLLGVTKPVVMSIKFNRKAAHPRIKKTFVGFSATGELKRSDYGMKFALRGIGDEVRIAIEALAVRK